MSVVAAAAAEAFRNERRESVDSAASATVGSAWLGFLDI
jgi:hypothetical protein